ILRRAGFRQTRMDGSAFVSSVVYLRVASVHNLT
ncbi:hypothetical protein CSUI_001190, partial [Cystoisospora suis]